MNKKLFYFVLIISALVLLTSCAPQGGTVTPPPAQPTTYTIKVVSGSADVWGTIYLNGMPTGANLIPWGAQTISGVEPGAAIYIVDTNGWVSHTELFNPLFGTTIIFDRFF